jgi:sucrose phosphorylase
MLALAGVPGIYVHSLLGSRSWREGVALTGHNRTINRQKIDRAVLEEGLADPASLRHQVFAAYRRLLRARAADPAFHPYGGQRVVFLKDGVFALLRVSDEGSQVLCLHNVSDQTQQVQLHRSDFDDSSGAWRDLLTGEVYDVANGADLALAPYGILWLKL